MVLSDALEFLFEYQLKLPGIETLITIRFYRDPRTDLVWFSQSHFIKTPLQLGPYMPGSPVNDTEERALNQAVSEINRWYQAAVRHGHQPSESWLVPNDDFPNIG